MTVIAWVFFQIGSVGTQAHRSRELHRRVCLQQCHIAYAGVTAYAKGSRETWTCCKSVDVVVADAMVITIASATLAADDVSPVIPM